MVETNSGFRAFEFCLMKKDAKDERTEVQSNKLTQAFICSVGAMKLTIQHVWNRLVTLDKESPPEQKQGHLL